jgi:uncharacterized protein (DUF1800 family)
MRHVRTWLRLSAALLIVAAVGAADRAPLPDDHRTIVHVLNRIGYGPRPGDVERVRAMGLARYIGRQLNPEKIADTEMNARLAPLTTLTMSTSALAEEYYLPALEERNARQRQQAQAGTAMEPPMRPESDARRRENRVLAELTEQRLLRAVYSERQLQEVLVDFWFNHFNVFAGKGPTRLYLTEYERDTIRPHVLDNFRDLVGAVAKSPAMLFYLDNWMNTDPNGPDMLAVQRDDMMRGRPNPANRRRPGIARQPGASRPVPPANAAPQAARRRRGLNENYARELMELHTLGVDGGYTQKDVVEVARAFTGWTLRQPRRGGSFAFEPRLHDDREKIVLGHRLEAGGGQGDGEQVLDILVAHPSTARFIATKLARRFVADDPPAALVERAAKRFKDTKGNIREVVRTIVESPEFTAPAAYRAKVKTPLEFVASALRVSGAGVNNAVALGRTLRELGMPLYFSQPPTGYADTSDAWVNTGALVARMNFAVDLVNNRVRGVSVDLASMVPGADRLRQGYGESAEASAKAETERARDALIARILSGDASANTRATIAKTNELTSMAALAIGAPEFQRR